jgi:TonB-linked SusC/RagA family outer membrane protein
MYKENSLNKYRTNANYKKYNFRANVDMNLTKTTLLEFGVGGWTTSKNKPGVASDQIWGMLTNITPVTVPVKFSNGFSPAFGTGNYANPYTLLNETGYVTEWETKVETNLGLKQNLSFITPGLNFYGRFAFDSYSWNNVSRIKWPDQYKAELQRDGKGELVLRKAVNASPLAQSTAAWGDKRSYTELNLNYDRVFNSIHRLGGLLLFYQQQYSRNNALGDVLASIPRKNMAMSGRLTYSLYDKYFLEANVGYTGSENFEKSKRFGLFPAIAGGWMVSEEKFIRDNFDWLNLLKIRGSYGRVGNDQLAQRFPYISVVGPSSGYTFGDIYQSGKSGGDITTIGANNLSWEISEKYNLGFDVKVFKHFTATVDVFKDTRSKIFMKRGYIPFTVGLSPGQEPWANVGKMVNKGIDGNLAYEGRIGKFSYTLRANATYAYTKVLDYDEAANALTYQMTKGYRWGQTRGLIAMGLFTNQKDIANSPTQNFGDVPLPGDIKYKDVNGDGVIDSKDVVPIGYSTIPGLMYGFGASTSYENFSLNFLFQGSGNSDFFLGGSGAYPFVGGETGNILQAVANPNNRWISSSISGTTATENPNAMFPRLSYGGNGNNYQNSTYWLRNARYLRLKNVEVGYTVPRNFIKRYKIESARFYVLGYDLLVFSPFKLWDPELANGNGAAYPIQKSITVGLTINL